MNRKDVEELLDHSKKSIEALKKSENISKVSVKNILENLRSALDYCAQYINNSILQRQSKVYFPYGKTEAQFKKSINRNFPSLMKINPQIYNLIEDLQYHKSQDQWLILMCEIANIAKHNKALDVETKVTESNVLSEISIPGAVRLSGFGNIQMENNWIEGKKIDDFELSNGRFVKYNKGAVTPNFRFEIVENKKVIINDYNCDLIELLEKVLKEVTAFKNELFM